MFTFAIIWVFTIMFTIYYKHGMYNNLVERKVTVCINQITRCLINNTCSFIIMSRCTYTIRTILVCSTSLTVDFIYLTAPLIKPEILMDLWELRVFQHTPFVELACPLSLCDGISVMIYLQSHQKTTQLTLANCQAIYQSVNMLHQHQNINNI